MVPVTTPWEEGELLSPVTPQHWAWAVLLLPAGPWLFQISGSSWQSWGRRTEHPQVPSLGRTGLFPLSNPGFAGPLWGWGTAPQWDGELHPQLLHGDSNRNEQLKRRQ